MANKDGRSRTASAQAVIREQVVDYLKRKLGTQLQASETFGITQRAVNKTWAQYRAGGLRAIKERKRG